MSYVKDPPTTLPEALARIKELEAKLEELKQAIEWGNMPAWVFQDMAEEIQRMRETRT